ncbi:hypothetical protein BUALT_Bualt13G0100800 [Buddleja alternifolia]|uniref:Uncharacterized protein n=1 Tax=Buddleja alternifolia TaxID=168488 RepID=A0AAV6WKE7_9LAMI|nr:hypothetical protein BUALT_Bualt13G0100800 [Buddleja alternifolia]
MGHRQVLQINHKWRDETKAFDGKKDHRSVPKLLSGVEILEQLSTIEHARFGKVINEHMLQLKVESEQSVDQRHDVHFPSWFRNRVELLRAERLATDELVSLANGPDTRVKYYNGCNVNGFRFHTKDHESNKKTQNSGEVVDGEHNQKIIEFYGVITDIIEMGGPGRRVDLHHSSLRNSSVDLHLHESQISRTIDNVDVDEEIVVNSTSTSSGKKKRGRTRNVTLSNEKLTVDIPEEVNRIVGVNSQYAITESGCLARRFAPLQVTKWGRIEEDKKLDWLRDFREEKKGEVVGPIELYKLTRYKCEEGAEEGYWISDIAKENHRKMVECRKEREEAGENPVDEEKICCEVLGFKSGYVSGRGAGPKPSTSRNYREELDEAKINARIAQEQVLVFSEQLENQKTVIEDLKEGLAATQRAMVESKKCTTEMMLFFQQLRKTSHLPAASSRFKFHVPPNLSHQNIHTSMHEFAPTNIQNSNHEFDSFAREPELRQLFQEVSRYNIELRGLSFAFVTPPPPAAATLSLSLHPLRCWLSPSKHNSPLHKAFLSFRYTLLLQGVEDIMQDETQAAEGGYSSGNYNSGNKLNSHTNFTNSGSSSSSGISLQYVQNTPSGPHILGPFQPLAGPQSGSFTAQQIALSQWLPLSPSS